MPNLIQEAKQQIQSILEKAYEACVENGELPGGTMLNGTVEIPRDISNGDFAANHAMTGAKALHMAPRQIAEKLIARMEEMKRYLDKITWKVNFFSGKLEEYRGGKKSSGTA